MLYILSQFELNKILFFYFNLPCKYGEAKHKIFYYEKLNCARKETKQYFFGIFCCESAEI